MDLLPVRMCKFLCIAIYHMQAWCYGGQKKSQDPLELELTTVVSYHVDAGN